MVIVILALSFILWTKNPLFAILSLICVFIGTSGLLLSLGVNFLALIYIVIYVGAICVLFLFVVMLLNIRQYDVKQRNLHKLPGVVISLLYLSYYSYVSSFQLNTNVLVENVYKTYFDLSDVSLMVLYFLQQPLIFVSLTLLLLLAIICPLVISSTKKVYEKKQDLYNALSRTIKTIVTVN